jgi:hypothetical protein
MIDKSRKFWHGDCADDIDEYLSLLTKEANEVKANEMLLDRDTRKGKYLSDIKLTQNRIVPDYFNDKSILEKFLAVKSLMI